MKIMFFLVRTLLRVRLSYVCLLYLLLLVFLFASTDLFYTP
jgi:hypothetical protein